MAKIIIDYVCNVIMDVSFTYMVTFMAIYRTAGVLYHIILQIKLSFGQLYSLYFGI